MIACGKSTGLRVHTPEFSILAQLWVCGDLWTDPFPSVAPVSPSKCGMWVS